MLYHLQRHHRRSIRLPGYDYTQAGVNFITACTYQRESLLGEVLTEQVVINKLGEIVLAAWQDLPSRFPTVVLDAFVVMPNHVHGVLVFTEPAEAGAEGQEGAARGEGAASSAPTLGQVMRTFKSLTAIRANRVLGRTQWPLWQRNYYEHIIRSEETLEKARRYIAQNPVRWDRDMENPVNL